MCPRLQKGGSSPTPPPPCPVLPTAGIHDSPHPVCGILSTPLSRRLLNLFHPSYLQRPPRVVALAGLHLHPAWMGSRWTSVFAVAASAPAVRSPFPHQLQDGAPGHARPPSGCCVGRAPACPPAAPNEPLNHSPILTHPHLSLSGRPLPGTNADPLNLPYFQHSPGFPTTSSRRPSGARGKPLLPLQRAPSAQGRLCAPEAEACHPLRWHLFC